MDWNYIFISLIILFAGAGVGAIVSGLMIFIIEVKFTWYYWEMEGNLLTTLYSSLTINNTTISLFGSFKTRGKPKITYYSIFLIRGSKDV